MPGALKASGPRQTLGQAELLCVAASPTLEVSDACSYYLEEEAAQRGEDKEAAEAKTQKTRIRNSLQFVT